MSVPSVRLTGGEPLVRRPVAPDRAPLSTIEQVADISLTTNGYLLSRHVDDLVAPGLRWINGSLDALAVDRFFELTRRDALAQVLQFLEAAHRHPELRPIKVNVVDAVAGQVLSEAGETALVPPVSGGAGAVRVTDAPLTLTSAEVAHDDAGAIVVFEGVTRTVERLDYEVNVEMAELRMRAMAEEAAIRPDLLAVAVQHRTGSVPRRESSVIVAVAAAHRGEAFAGARSIIDRIKSEVPI